MENIIEIKALNKSYKKAIILDNIDLKIEKGMIYGFTGYNGSGKSMLFKAICGFIIPTSGEIKVFNDILTKNSTFPNNVGLLIEHPGFIPEMSGFQNLKYLAGIRNTIGDKEIKEAMELVGLDPKVTKKVRTYSLGMKQRLGIAQAIMEKPELIILDEAFNGLDKSGVEQIRALLTRLKSEGKTILMSSHMSEDIEVLCDHVFELDKGKIKEIR
jgi:ABC-2 type transport system ATP-binding protein